jgi:hypothetical protein
MSSFSSGCEEEGQPGSSTPSWRAREAAEADLREILEDEPDWKDVLRVVLIELDGRNVSAN